jgi:hypothetical protein
VFQLDFFYQDDPCQDKISAKFQSKGLPAELVKGGDDGEKGRSSSQPAKKNHNYYFN